eukprot:TRINITY_DN14218_c0_g1_i1.p1 TRINITY_DN14218_c0_g1~~TRINITY_DN14218_c0_g1_i1.p1  ORF type:complete len:133 (+),score=27.15 TRINITY_DN14218_c0_g1_i1:27-425(+)
MCIRDSNYQVRFSSNVNHSNQLPSGVQGEGYAKLDGKRKMLLYRSKERGMLENDLILGTFAYNNLSNLSEAQVDQYELILNQLDPDLYQWLTNKAELPPELDNEVMAMLKAHTQNRPLKDGNLYEGLSLIHI